MDMLSATVSPPPSKAEKPWPEGRAVRGKTYGVNDPVFAGTQLAVMTMETWLDFGTIHEQQRRKVEQQDRTLIQLHATNEVLTKELADLKLKHENLKIAVKRQRKASMGFIG